MIRSTILSVLRDGPEHCGELIQQRVWPEGRARALEVLKRARKELEALGKRAPDTTRV